MDKQNHLEVVQPLREPVRVRAPIAHHLVRGTKHAAELAVAIIAGAGAALVLLALFERVLQ